MVAYKKVCQCPREVTGVAFGKWRQFAGVVSWVAKKYTSVSSRSVQVGSQKLASVCKRSVDGGTENVSQSPREKSRVEPNIGVNVQG
jgi:hypothetical protein